MSDPIAPHSAPIAAYMSVHEGACDEYHCPPPTHAILTLTYSYQSRLCKILWPY